MKRWLVRLIWVVALAAVGFWGWRMLFPGPEQVVRKRLAELARLASVAPNEAPLARMMNAQKLVGYFAPEVEISVDVPGHSVRTFQGREDLLEAAVGARSMGQGFRVEFLDVNVDLAPDRESAIAHFTLKATVPDDRMPQVQELKARFRKRDGDWLIDHVETVRTLR